MLSEDYERLVSQSTSTEGPPGQTFGSWERGAGRVGSENRRGHWSKLDVPLGRCLEIPEASRFGFLPGARGGPALAFGRIQRRENATDGSGGRHPGAFDGGSPRPSGGHRSCRAGREEGKKIVVLLAGRPVAVVVELAVVAEPWIQGSADVPGHGRSCEHFDDPTGTEGPEGERQVFARSGFNSFGILFFDPQMIKIWIHR